MKIDRLMAILTILLRQEKITAPELADRLRYPAGPSAGIWMSCARQEYRW